MREQVDDLNTTRLDGKTASISDVLAAAGALPFLADKRLVIVEGLLTWLGRKGAGKSAKNDLDRLVEALPQLPESTRLIFLELEQLKPGHALLKLALREDAHGFAKDYSPPRDPRDRSGARWDMAWIVKWITRRVEHYGGKIEPKAASALAAVIDQDVYAMDSECAKLVDYAGPGQVITEADVAAMTTYVPEANIFDIVDAMGHGNGAQAVLLIHRLLDDPKQQAFGLLGMINRQFRLLIQVREALDMGSNPRELPDLQGKSFMAQKLLEQARRFSLQQLEAIYRNLLETDFAIKMGRVSDALALDLLVAGLSA
jgi:DNA polymerase-3 subunit delta